MSLLDLKSSMQGEAIQGIGQSEQMEQERKMLNEQNKAQAKTQTMSAVGTGAAIGTTILPGWGTAIGAGVGFLADALL
jgi:hypothetical protein